MNTKSRIQHARPLSRSLFAIALLAGLTLADNNGQRECAKTKVAGSYCPGQVCTTDGPSCGAGKICLTTFLKNSIGACISGCGCKKPGKKDPKGKQVNGNAAGKGGAPMFLGMPTQVPFTITTGESDWTAIWDQNGLDDFGIVSSVQELAGAQGFAGGLTVDLGFGPPEQVPITVSAIALDFGAFDYLGKNTGLNSLTIGGETDQVEGYYDSNTGVMKFNRWVPVELTNDLFPQGKIVHLTIALTPSGQPGEYSVDIDMDAFLDVGTNFCSANTNSTGSASEISAQGSDRVSYNLLQLTASEVPAGNTGLFFYGRGQSQVPFGDGFLCISSGAGYQRLAPTTADGDGFLISPLDLSLAPHVGQMTPGSTWLFQAWYRDIAGGGAGFNLSDGLVMTFQP